jgi:drug/metabolite transporter (DMT)-like permease
VINNKLEQKSKMVSDNKSVKFIVLFFGVISISAAAIFIRLAQKEVNSFVIAAARMMFSAIPLIPIVIYRHLPELRKLSKKDLLLSLLAGLFLAIHFATWVSSLEYTTIASSVVIVCTTPIWVTLFGLIFYHEKVDKVILIGIFLTLLGGIIIALSENCSNSILHPVCNFEMTQIAGNRILGNILALLGALTAAGYLMIGKTVRKQVSLVPYIFIVYATSAIFLCLLLIFTGTEIHQYQPLTYLWLLLLAIFPQLIGHSLFNWSLKYISATYVAISTMGEPVGSTILAIIIFREIPTPLKVLGALIILTGIYIVSKESTTG